MRELTSYDHKDKITGTIIQTVKEVKESGDKVEIIVDMEMRDKKGEQISKGELLFTCEDGIFKIDMKNYLDPATMAGMEGMEVTVDATDLEMPSKLEPGMELDDGTVTMVTQAGVMSMNFKTHIHNRKVEGRETIETPAGTFECYRISQDADVKSIVNVSTKSTEWVAEDVGVVKSESYNKNGKLTGYTLLTRFE